jgi:hypothetical protein
VLPELIDERRHACAFDDVDAVTPSILQFILNKQKFLLQVSLYAFRHFSVMSMREICP